MRSKEEEKIPQVCTVIRECQWYLKREGFFTVQAVFAYFRSLSVAIKSEPSFPFSKMTRKMYWRETHFQARLCKMVVAVCYFKSSPFLPKRIGLILGEVCTKPQCPPLHIFPPCLMISWWVRGAKYFEFKEWIILCSVYCKNLGCIVFFLEVVCCL